MTCQTCNELSGNINRMVEKYPVNVFDKDQYMKMLIEQTLLDAHKRVKHECS